MYSNTMERSPYQNNFKTWLEMDNKRGLFITEVVSKIYERVLNNLDHVIKGGGFHSNLQIFTLFFYIKINLFISLRLLLAKK